MTTLLVHSEHTPCAVQIPALAQIIDEQFDQFCQANSELRLERCATREVMIRIRADRWNGHGDSGERCDRLNTVPEIKQSPDWSVEPE